jgi:hypothetical protein
LETHVDDSLTGAAASGDGVVDATNPERADGLAAAPLVRADSGSDFPRGFRICQKPTPKMIAKGINVRAIVLNFSRLEALQKPAQSGFGLVLSD